MKKTSIGLIVVAIVQFIPIIIMPLNTLKAMSLPIWGVIAALFLLLGVSLVRRHEWARTASIFVQGFNVIVRLLMFMNNSVHPEDAGGGVNLPVIISFTLSMVLSMLLLQYFDQPDVQLQMQS